MHKARTFCLCVIFSCLQALKLQNKNAFENLHQNAALWNIKKLHEVKAQPPNNVSSKINHVIVRSTSHGLVIKRHLYDAHHSTHANNSNWKLLKNWIHMAFRTCTHIVITSISELYPEHRICVQLLMIQERVQKSCFHACTAFYSSSKNNYF